MSIHALCGQDHPPGTSCPRIELSDEGVMLLARAPGQVADNTGKSTGSSTRRATRSGNPNFDPGSGRFGSGIGNAPKPGPDPNAPVNPVVVARSGLPQGVDQGTWEKRLDVVRDAAREMAELDGKTAQSFLKGRVQDLSQVNIDQFLVDVRAQQLDDLVDALNDKGTVKVKAGKRWVTKIFSGLADSEVQSVVTRLLNRGWNQRDIKKKVTSKIRDESRRQRLEQSIG